VAAVIAVLAFILFGCLFKWTPEMISPYLLFLTLIAISWYSWETRGLKKEMVLQNELSLRPRLVFFAIQGRELWVKNIGKGAALDIQIGGYSLKFPGIMEIEYKFECQSLLEPGEATDLWVSTGTGEATKLAEYMDRAQLEPESAPNTIIIKLSYKNVLGKEYKNDTSTLGKGMLQKTQRPE